MSGDMSVNRLISSAASYLQNADKATVKKDLGTALKKMGEVVISATTFYPCSSRGIVLNLVKTPFRLLQSTASGLKQAIQGRSIKNLGSNIAANLESHMKKDWGGGISDLETKLRPGDPIAKENLKYAGYMTSSGSGVVNRPAEAYIRNENEPLPTNAGLNFMAGLGGDAGHTDNFDEMFLDAESQTETRNVDENVSEKPLVQYTRNENELPNPEIGSNIKAAGIGGGGEEYQDEFIMGENGDAEDVVVTQLTTHEEVRVESKESEKPKEIDPTLAKVIEGAKKLGFTEDSNLNFYNKETGVSFHIKIDADALGDKKELVLCFHGMGATALDIPDRREPGNRESIATKAGMLKTQAFEIVADFLGTVPDSAKQAIKLGKMLKEIAAQENLTPVVVGHSHGGGLAQCAAAGSGIKGVVFNSRPMGAGVRRYIGQAKVAKNAENITAFSGKGDILSNTRGLNALAVFTERVLGIAVPRTVGKSYYIPVKANYREDFHPTGNRFVDNNLDIHNQYYQQLDAIANPPA